MFVRSALALQVVSEEQRQLEALEKHVEELAAEKQAQAPAPRAC